MEFWMGVPVRHHRRVACTQAGSEVGRVPGLTSSSAAHSLRS